MRNTKQKFFLRKTVLLQNDPKYDATVDIDLGDIKPNILYTKCK